MSTADSTPEAVPWLRRSYRVGALVDALAAVGMAYPKLYGPTLRFDRRFRRTGPEFTYAMRMGAPLMAGWTIVPIWADRQPLERRGVLPITVLPVIAGLTANDATLSASGACQAAVSLRSARCSWPWLACFCYSLARARTAAKANGS